jgi:hypothetical protein
MIEGQVIDVRPGQDDAFAVVARLSGTAVRFRLRWLPRLGLWTCLPTYPDGSELGTEQLVRGGGELLVDPRVTRGVLTWDGPDPYLRADLGETLRLIYVPR